MCECAWIDFFILMQWQYKIASQRRQNLTFHWHVVVKIDSFYANEWPHIVWLGICTHFTDSDKSYTHMHSHPRCTEPHFQSISISHLLLFAESIFWAHFFRHVALFHALHLFLMWIIDNNKIIETYLNKPCISDCRHYFRRWNFCW